jgi:hypothetical protein
MKDIEDILSDFQRGYNAREEQMEKAINDQIFASVDGAQWAGQCGDRWGEKIQLTFDKFTRELNRLIGEYNANPISVKFLPNDEDAEQELSDILQDRFRNDSRKSDGQEAGDNAVSEAFTGGYGAMRLVTKYENELDPDQNKQFVSFEPILSAASVVVRDADAKKFDKSDSTQTWVLHEYTRHKFDELYPGKAPWPNGTQSDFTIWDMDWYGKETVYVAEYYEVIEKKRTRLVFETPTGETIKFFKDEMDDDDLFEVSFYEQVGTERVKCRYIEKALLCGDSILEKPKKIAGKFIPIIDFYGYRTYIKGKEYFMGEVRKQRDRQTFNNMAVSMLAQTMTESQKEKMIFAPEQMTPKIAEMWASDNVDNHPFLYAEPLKDGQGNVLSPGPIGRTSAPQVPPAVLTSIQMINQDMAEELGNGELKVPANTSQEAIAQVQDRADMSYYILAHNAKKSWKHAGSVYLEIAKEIYGVERMMRTVSEDGAINMVEMKKVDYSEGLPKVTNDITIGSYEVVTDTGPSYSTRREADLAAIQNAMSVTDPTNPMYNFMYSQMLQSMDGQGMDTIRKVARLTELEQLLSISPELAVQEAKTDEEKAYLQQKFQQMNQPPQPDPMLEIAKIDSETKMIQAQTAQAKAMNDHGSLQLKAVQTQADGALKEAQTVKTIAEAQEINKKSQRENAKTVADIYDKQENRAFSIAERINKSRQQRAATV